MGPTAARRQAGGTARCAQCCRSSRSAQGKETAFLHRWDLTNELSSDARALLARCCFVWCLCGLLQAFFFFFPPLRLKIACKKPKSGNPQEDKTENQGRASSLQANPSSGGTFRHFGGGGSEQVAGEAAPEKGSLPTEPR